MAADAMQDEVQAHQNTFAAFSKLVLFAILWIVLLLCSLALGLIGHVGLIALLLGVGGTIILLIAFAVLG